MIFNIDKIVFRGVAKFLALDGLIPKEIHLRFTKICVDSIPYQWLKGGLTPKDDQMK